MKKKICPYCDRVMKNPCYCGFCRRFVFRPKEQEVEYYLNERHPAAEENCSYHGELPASVQRPAVSAPERGKTVPETVRSRTKMPAGITGQTKNTKKRTSNPFFRAIGVYMIVMVMLSLFRNFGGFGRKAETAPMPEPVLEEETALRDWERSDEQVIEEGIACNSYGHLDVDAETAISVFQKKVEAAGYSMEELYHSSLNMAQEDTCFYNTFYEFDLLADDMWKGNLELSFDTATGQMHGFRIRAEGEEFWKAAGGAVEFMKEQEILPEWTNTEALLADLKEKASQSSIGVISEGGLEIRLVFYEGEKEEGCALSLYARQ